MADKTPTLGDKIDDLRQAVASNSSGIGERLKEMRSVTKELVAFMQGFSSVAESLEKIVPDDHAEDRVRFLGAIQEHLQKTRTAFDAVLLRCKALSEESNIIANLAEEVGTMLSDLEDRIPKLLEEAKKV